VMPSCVSSSRGWACSRSSSSSWCRSLRLQGYEGSTTLIELRRDSACAGQLLGGRRVRMKRPRPPPKELAAPDPVRPADRTAIACTLVASARVNPRHLTPITDGWPRSQSPSCSPTPTATRRSPPQETAPDPASAASAATALGRANGTAFENDRTPILLDVSIADRVVRALHTRSRSCPSGSLLSWIGSPPSHDASRISLLVDVSHRVLKRASQIDTQLRLTDPRIDGRG
jgi:hypothetical protein